MKEFMKIYGRSMLSGAGIVIGTLLIYRSSHYLFEI